MPLQVSGTLFLCASLTKINVQAAAVSSELALMLEPIFLGLKKKKKLFAKALQMRILKKTNV